MTLRLAEVFPTVQGEGVLIGTPSLFVRTHGCNLRCEWCDTPNTSRLSHLPENKPQKVEVEKLLNFIVNEQPLDHIVVTGGEPMLQAADLFELARALYEVYHVTLESNGSLYPKVPLHTLVHLLSLSPKLSEDDWSVSKQLIDECAETPGTSVQLKVVVTDRAELELALVRLAALWRATNGRFTPIIQPESSRGTEWVRSVMNHLASKSDCQIPVRVIPQIHVLVGVR